MNVKRCLIAGVLGMFLTLVGQGVAVGALAQGGNGQIGGIVQDSSKALVPGVTVTLKNVDTGVTNTQISNESGSYNFSSVPPGAYSVTGTLPGFKASVTNNVQVGVAAQLRVNITLEIGALDAKVEVNASPEQLLTESSASVGDVLTAARSLDLPLVGTDILDLVRILPGYRISPDSNPGVAVNDTFAGQNLSSANVTRDGMSVTSGRYEPTQYGLTTGTNINPDLVGEIRLILAPVDAELGRGNAQIQILTRSGTNRYTGSAVWRIQNSALSANSWGNNNDILGGVWTPTQPNWRNSHNVTLTYGGPIVRNKTFFFASWEQQISNTRTLQTATVYTDAGRQGIFRYWEKWNPQDAAVTNDPTTYPVTATSASRRSVDSSGTPLRPDRNPDGTPYVGGLRCFSVFGNVKFDGSPFTQADCAGGTAAVNATPWDQFRLTPDTTGYIAKVLRTMPHANYWETGDGLNTAGFRWLRGAKGDAGGGTAGSATARAGVTNFVNRKQINIKIDENLGNHRISGNWSYQRDDSGDFLAVWPGGVNGETQRRPQILTITATSTLSSSMLNEARFGVRRDNTSSYAPIQSDRASIREAAAEWYLTGGANPENGKTYPVSYVATLTGSNTGSIGALLANSQTFGSISPLYNYADTFSWTRGRHAFKIGGEIRLTRSNGFNSVGGNVIPAMTSGAGGLTSRLATPSNFTAELPNFLQSGRTGSAALLYFMNGSVNSASMLRWIDDSTDVTGGHWEDTTTVGRKFRDQVQNEWDVFWKDDWKLTNDITLNLGLRYESYGSPYIGSGFTTAPLNLGAGMFGNTSTGSGGLFDRWLRPGSTFLTGYGNAAAVTAANALACTPGVTQSALLPVSSCDPNKLTKIEFVGPNTPNPAKVAVPKDSNNFGPAVGFAWQLPWFGKGKTTLRGGYQLTYGGPARNGVGLDSFLGSAPGALLSSTTNTADTDIAAILATRALNLTDVARLVPVRPTTLPGQTLPIYGRAAAVESYDPQFATPYTQNLTLQLTRSLNRRMTVDVRYVGTLARKMDGTVNLNQPTVFDNPELFQALADTRAGKDAPLFDRMFAGLNISGQTSTGWGAVGTCVTQAANSTAPGRGAEGCGANQVKQHGSAHLRRSATFAANLANGNFVGVINSLANSSTVQGNTLQALPTGVSGVSARILRNGCDRIANGLYNPAAASNPLLGASTANIPTTCFPEDYFIAAPQFSAATFHGNFGHNNYHSLQTQFTLRPTQGSSLQMTHTWQKLLTNQYGNYVDVRNRNADYSLSRTSAAQEIRMNGTFELPLGPNRLLFGSASGWIARAIERWQSSVIFNYSTGAPRDAYTSAQFLYAGGDGGNGPQARPDVVGPWVNPKTNFLWNGPNNNSGTIFGAPSPFAVYDDPQCANLVSGSDGMGTNLRSSCTLNGLAVIVPAGTAGAQLMEDGITYGIPVLRNPLPGKQGNLSARTLRAPGYWSMDANVSKSFRIGESRSVQLRFDSTNILNHPNPGGPIFNIQSSNFGGVTADKTGSRSFQGQLRLSF